MYQKSNSATILSVTNELIVRDNATFAGVGFRGVRCLYLVVDGVDCNPPFVDCIGMHNARVMVRLFPLKIMTILTLFSLTVQTGHETINMIFSY